MLMAVRGCGLWYVSSHTKAELQERAVVSASNFINGVRTNMDENDTFDKFEEVINKHMAL